MGQMFAISKEIPFRKKFSHKFIVQFC